MDERDEYLKKKNKELENLQEEYNNIKKVYEEKINDLKDKKKKLIEMIDKKREYTINYLRSNENYNNELSNLNIIFRQYYDNVDIIYIENVKKINKKFRNDEDEYQSKIKRLKIYIDENYKNNK